MNIFGRTQAGPAIAGTVRPDYSGDRDTSAQTEPRYLDIGYHGGSYLLTLDPKLRRRLDRAFALVAQGKAGEVESHSVLSLLWTIHRHETSEVTLVYVVHPASGWKCGYSAWGETLVSLKFCHVDEDPFVHREHCRQYVRIAPDDWQPEKPAIELDVYEEIRL